MNLMFSLHVAFQNISNMVRDNHGAGEPLPFVLLDPPKQRPQDSLILVFRFQQNVNKFRSLQGGSYVPFYTMHSDETVSLQVIKYRYSSWFIFFHKQMPTTKYLLTLLAGMSLCPWSPWRGLGEK